MITVRSSFRVRVLVLLSVGAFVTSCASYSSRYYKGTEDLALEGYDPVAYFTEQSPSPGDPRYRYDWQGATWQFASQEHLDLFRADPERYAPQYGGYCAWGVANNRLIQVDPEVWSVVDGNLYLNFNRKVQEDWVANQEEYLRQAESNWPGLRAGLEP